jgi:uroporphyrinogen-III synthase
LEDEGAEVLALPFLELLPPKNGLPLQAAAEHIHRYAWVVFASPSAAQALAEALRRAGSHDRARSVKVAVVGPQTGRSAAAHGFQVSLEAAPPTGIGLLQALTPHVAVGMEVLLPVAEDGRAELFEGLVRLGVQVTRVAAYGTAPAAVDEEAWTRVGLAPVDAVLFGSPRTVEAFFEGAHEAARSVLRSARLVAIGPTTAQALRERGFEPAEVAKEPTPAGLLEAAARALQ